MANIESKVENLIENTINNLGYILYDVEYVKEGKNYYLRVYIDSKKGISIEDCEKVNNAISDILDKADYIKDAYFLEISSPGIERVLRKEKHFQENIGNEIEISLFKPLNGKKCIIGILEDYNLNNIIIKLDEDVIEIPKNNISIIKKTYKWE